MSFFDRSCVPMSFWNRTVNLCGCPTKTQRVNASTTGRVLLHGHFAAPLSKGQADLPGWHVILAVHGVDWTLVVSAGPGAGELVVVLGCEHLFDRLLPVRGAAALGQHLNTRAGHPALLRQD